HGDRANELPAGQSWQPPALLILRAMIQHVVRADTVYALPEATETAPALLLVENRLIAEIRPTPTVFGRNIHTEKSLCAGLAPHFPADTMLGAPLHVLRHHLGLDEPADTLAKNLQLIVHPG